jgi:hypothetical protein
MTYLIARREERLAGAARGAADWLGLAAAPTFAAMALLTAVLGSGPQDVLCSAMPDVSLLTGMAWMYMLMSAIHSAPWLRLISNRRSIARKFRSPAPLESRHTCHSQLSRVGPYLSHDTKHQR